jgi:hypothetical protein
MAEFCATTVIAWLASRVVSALCIMVLVCIPPVTGPKEMLIARSGAAICCPVIWLSLLSELACQNLTLVSSAVLLFKGSISISCWIIVLRDPSAVSSPEARNLFRETQALLLMVIQSTVCIIGCATLALYGLGSSLLDIAFHNFVLPFKAVYKMVTRAEETKVPEKPKGMWKKLVTSWEDVKSGKGNAKESTQGARIRPKTGPMAVRTCEIYLCKSRGDFLQCHSP